MIRLVVNNTPAYWLGDLPWLFAPRDWAELHAWATGAGQPVDTSLGWLAVIYSRVLAANSNRAAS